MDNSCIIAHFHLDKPSVSAWFHFSAHFSVAYRCSWESGSRSAGVGQLLECLWVAGLSWSKMAPRRSRGLRLHRVSQNGFCPCSFLSIYNLSAWRTRGELLSLCAQHLALTLSRWPCHSIHQRSGSSLELRTPRLPSWVSRTGVIAWLGLGNKMEDYEKTSQDLIF